ncbi:unnamed protein product, partial [Effrenium voratum]
WSFTCKYRAESHMEVRFPPRPIVNCALGALRCCANVSPRCFVGCMHYGIFPSLDCLQGCLSRNLLRQPAKGTPPEIKAEWLMLDEPHSDSSRVILYLPGGGFVARDHTASVFAARVLARLAPLRRRFADVAGRLAVATAREVTAKRGRPQGQATSAACHLGAELSAACAS